MRFAQLGAVTAWAILASFVSCSKSAEDCSYTASCGVGDVDSGASCNPACSGATPVCDESTKKCVECSKNADCAASGRPFCDTDGECIQCRSSADCTNAAASVCIAGTCTGCSSNSDCSHVAGKAFCKLPSAGGAGSCVACTTSDESACAGDSCDPATNSCTTTRVATVAVCHACAADSECAPGAYGPTARCVTMSFKGAAHGSYCLNRASAGPCAQPYTVSLSAVSVSGAPAEAYCGINQEATTCEAVVDLIGGKTCTRNNNCGSGLGDGLCENFSTPPAAQSMRCSIPCTSSTQCSQLQTCTSTVNGYCH